MELWNLLLFPAGNLSSWRLERLFVPPGLAGTDFATKRPLMAGKARKFQWPEKRRFLSYIIRSSMDLSVSVLSGDGGRTVRRPSFAATPGRHRGCFGRHDPCVLVARAHLFCIELAHIDLDVAGGSSVAQDDSGKTQYSASNSFGSWLYKWPAVPSHPGEIGRPRVRRMLQLLYAAPDGESDKRQRGNRIILTRSAHQRATNWGTPRRRQQKGFSMVVVSKAHAKNSGRISTELASVRKAPVAFSIVEQFSASTSFVVVIIARLFSSRKMLMDCNYSYFEYYSRVVN